MPGVATGTCQREIEHLQAWAADNNLELNRDKTKEIVFSARRKVALPLPRPDIERVSSLRVLGVILNDKLTAADHVTALLSSGSSMLYAMRVLCLHSTPTTSLRDIFRATVISRILYATPSWSDMCSSADHVRLDSLLRRSGLLQMRHAGHCSILLTTTFSSASKLTLTMSFSHIFLNIQTLHTSFAPALTTSLIKRIKFLNDTDFIIRMLCKFLY